MTRQHETQVATVEWEKGRTGDRWRATCTGCGHSEAYVSAVIARLVARRHNLGEHGPGPENVEAGR